MRVFDYRRHAKKQGDLIGQEGLDDAYKLGKLCQPQRYQIVAAGALPRTWQTAASWLLGYGFEHVDVRLRALPAVPEFGDAKMFQSWMDRGFAEAAAKKGNNIEALRVILPSEEFEETQATALKGVEAIFAAMQDNDVGAIGFGHSPIIELAAECLNCRLDGRQLKELQGIRFIQEDNGTIVIPSHFLLDEPKD